MTVTVTVTVLVLVTVPVDVPMPVTVTVTVPVPVNVNLPVPVTVTVPVPVAGKHPNLRHMMFGSMGGHYEATTPQWVSTQGTKPAGTAALDASWYKWLRDIILLRFPPPFPPPRGHLPGHACVPRRRLVLTTAP